MIRVKLLSEPEYRALQKAQAVCSDYDASQFYDLLRSKGEFTDAESLTLLRHLHGEEAAAGKWYRRTTADGTPCLPAISPEAMYGLVVIENSRNGRYTPMAGAFTAIETEIRMEESLGGSPVSPLVWQAFAQLDMDILLVFRKKDFSFAWEIPIEEAFILENYPMDGKPVAVHVVSEYLREPEQRDGVWYVHNFFYDQKYSWSEDTGEILECLRQEFMGQPPLIKGLFPLETFEAMCRPGETEDPCIGCRLYEEPEQSPMLDPEEAMFLRQCLQCLSDEDRTIVILHAVARWKHRQIADYLQLPLSTVLSKYHRAIKKLREQL